MPKPEEKEIKKRPKSKRSQSKNKDDVDDADDDMIENSNDDKSRDEGAVVKVKKVVKVGKESKVIAEDISMERSESNSESDCQYSLESPKTPSKSIPQKVTPPLVAVTSQNFIRAPFSQRSGQSNAVKMPPKEQMSKPVKKPVPAKQNKKEFGFRNCTEKYALQNL